MIFVFKLIIILFAILNVIFVIKSISLGNIKSIVMSIITLAILFVVYISLNMITPKSTTTVSNSNILRIATEGAYYPWNYISSKGKPEGFDVEIAKEVAKRINKTPKISILSWESLIPSLINKQSDIVSSALSITKDRKNSVSFSIPYAQIKASFFGKGNLAIQNQNADLPTLKKVLKGKIIGAQSGTTLPLFLAQEFKDIVKIKYYSTQVQLMMEVKSGRVDAGFSEIPSINDYIIKNPQIKLFGPTLGSEDNPIFGEGIAIATSKNNVKLLEEVNKALLSMHKDGTIKALSIKYFGTDVSYKGNN